MSKNKILIYGRDDNLQVKSFDSLEEFQQYYDLHKDEIESTSTTRLNRMYRIKGYKITRRKIGDAEEKTLCFRQMSKMEMTPKPTEMNTDVDELTHAVGDMRASIKELEMEISKIKQQLIEIINVINGTT